MANSRMKDFYDLWELSRRFDFDGSTLMAAIQATFQRRATAFPRGTPLSLSPEFYDAPSKRTQWTAFIRKSGLQSETLGEWSLTSRRSCSQSSWRFITANRSIFTGT